VIPAGGLDDQARVGALVYSAITEPAMESAVAR
jgi:hypothetical protein